MALLTAPFPQNDPTALARLVLSGMSELQQNLKAQQEISQNEQEQATAQSKIAASNVLNLANIQAQNREEARRASQDSFNNMIGLQELGIKQADSSSLIGQRNANTSLLLRQMNSPGISSDDSLPVGSVVGAPGSSPPPMNTAPTLPNAGTGQPPPQDMAAPSMPGQMPQGSGAPVTNTLLAPADQPSGVLTSPGNQAAPAAVAPNTAVADDASWAAQMAGGAAGTGLLGVGAMTTPGLGGSLLVQKPEDWKGAAGGSPAADKTPDSAGPAAPPASSASSPWIKQDGSVDLTKIPVGQQVKIAPNVRATRFQEGNASLIQFYKPEIRTVNKVPQTIFVPNGPPKPVLPDSLSTAPAAVILPKDKVQAFETSKWWLDKIFPKMDAKDRQANVQQAQQLHQTMMDLANDPDVQSHLRKIDNADFAAPSGMTVVGSHYDPKREMMVPTMKKTDPDELKVAANQRATLKSMWDDYKGLKTQVDAGGMTPQTEAKAKAKMNGLFSEILKMDPSFAQRAGAAPSGQSGGTPVKDASTYYGQ